MKALQSYMMSRKAMIRLSADVLIRYLLGTCTEAAGSFWQQNRST